MRSRLPAQRVARRPREKGPKLKLDLSPDPAFDVNAKDVGDLAARMVR